MKVNAKYSTSMFETMASTSNNIFALNLNHLIEAHMADL